MFKLFLLSVSLILTLAVAGGMQLPWRTVSWPEAESLLAHSQEDLPPELRELRTRPPEQRSKLWDEWVTARRLAVSARVAQGEEDSIVNLLLFGTSFTAEPRITAARLTELDRRWRAGDPSAEGALRNAYQQRAADLVDAVVRPGARERLRFTRQVLEQQGHTLTTAEGREAAVGALLGAVIRVREEAARLTRVLEGLSESSDAAATSERAQLFRERGLAPDSSVLTQYAVDAAVCGLSATDPASRRSLNRIAVVGPGLDFVDKQEGLDFYDPQSLQPFTVMDSVLRCDLAVESRLRTTILDINPRVTEHVRAVAAGAIRPGRKTSHRLVFPRLLNAEWTEEATAYWRGAGLHIGAAAGIVVPASLKGVVARAIQVRPALAARVHAADANIVYDRIEPSDDNLFDLVVITNVLVYYDRFEQTLAVASLAAMLRPGGLLLTNTTLPDVPEVQLRSHSQYVVRYSSRPGDGERMRWYQRVGLPDALRQPRR